MICSSCSSCYLSCRCTCLIVSICLVRDACCPRYFLLDSGSHWILISLTTFFLSLETPTLDYLDLCDSTKTIILLPPTLMVATCSKMFIGGLNWDTTDGILSPCYDAYIYIPLINALLYSFPFRLDPCTLAHEQKV
jgi:hypothetical protein